MDTKEKILDLLKTIKIFINQEGGDVNFIDLKDDVCTLKISGACVGCIDMNNTFEFGVKRILMQEIPELKNVLFIV